jgi:hypothetical protein
MELVTKNCTSVIFKSCHQDLKSTFFCLMYSGIPILLLHASSLILKHIHILCISIAMRKICNILTY